MATITDHFGVTLIDLEQTGKTTEANRVIQELEYGMARTLAKVPSSDITLTDSEWKQNGIFRFTGTVASGRTITVPLVSKHGLFVHAGSSNPLILKASGSSMQFSLPVGRSALMSCDGTDLNPVTVGSPTIELVHSEIGNPASGAIIWKHVFSRAAELPASLTGSRARLGTGPAGAVTFPIKKNESTSIGTINFAIGATTATFTFSTLQSFAVGDRIQVEAPNPQDGSLADPAFALLANLT